MRAKIVRRKHFISMMKMNISYVYENIRNINWKRVQ